MDNINPPTNLQAYKAIKLQSIFDFDHLYITALRLQVANLDDFTLTFIFSNEYKYEIKIVEGEMPGVSFFFYLQLGRGMKQVRVTNKGHNARGI